MNRHLSTDIIIFKRNEFMNNSCFVYLMYLPNSFPNHSYLLR